MNKTAIVSARLDVDSLAALDSLAAITERSRAWILARAVRRYVDEELEFRAFVRKGIEDIDAGRVRTQQEVEAMFNVRRATRDAA